MEAENTLETAAKQPHDQQQHHGADRGKDDFGHKACAEMNAKSRKYQAGEQRTGDTDDDIADDPKAGAPHYLSGQPARDQADKQNNQNTFIGYPHKKFPQLVHATFARYVSNLLIIAGRDDSNLPDG
jgi:hypothetical protein